MANIKNAVKLGVFTLAIMNVTAVVSLRGLPAEAVYGMSSAFYYLLQLLSFLFLHHSSQQNWRPCSRINKAVCSGG